MAESNRDEIAKLEALYANNPDGRVFTHLAEAYRKAGELERAREVLDRGLRRHADYASAHVVFGRVLADQGLESEAAASFQRVLQLDPENLIARRALAESERAAGHLEQALVHYRELLAHDASDEDVRTIVADLDARLHPPAATSSSAVQGSSHEESWDATPQEPISLDSTFGAAPQPPAPEPPLPLDEPLSLDSVSFGGALDAGGAFDLGLVDFGAREPTAAFVQPGGTEEPVEGALTPPEGVESAGADESADASGWGDWPGAAPAPEAVTADERATSEAESEEPPPESEAGMSPAGAVTEPDEDLAVAPPEGLRVEEPPADEASAPEAEPVREPPADEASAPEAEPVREAVAPPEVPAGEAFAPVDARVDDASRPAETTLEATPGAPLRDVMWEREHGVPSPAAAPGMPTETLAALYRAQGFPDRAASVYRALLQRRPDDAGLEERARAMEAEAESLRTTQTGVEETRDVWVSGGADTWDVDAIVARAHALDAEDDSGDAGPSITEYFHRLLAWRSAVAPATTGADVSVGEPAGAGHDESASEPAVERPEESASEPAVEAPEGTAREPAKPEFDDALASTLLPFVFGEERTEPVEHGEHVEHVEHDEIGEASPFAFDLEADEPDAFAAPLPFAFTPGADEAGEEEPPRFAFESMVADEEPTDSDEAVAFDFESMTSPVADEEQAEPVKFGLAGEAAPALWAGFAFDDAPAAEPPAAAAPPLADAPESDPWGAPSGERAAAAADAGAGHDADGLLFLHEAEAIGESPALEEAGWDPTVALADVFAAERPKPAPRPLAPARPVAADEEEEDDDDDLEMFRSWLQSLKK